MSYNRTLAIIFMVVSFFSVSVRSTATAMSLSSPSPLATGLSQILSKAPANAHIGVIVQSMQTGKILYDYDADYLFTPASVQKLFVATTALSLLKPNYHFATRLLSNARIENGVLNGDLIVQFSGDPTLQKTDLLDLLGQLKKQGVRQINGHVYVDNTVYDNVPYPRGWFWDDLTYNYAAPLNAVIINENQFSLVLSPSSSGPATVSVSVPDGVVKVENQTTSQRSCALSIYSDFSNDYEITGCVPSRSGKQYRSLALRNPVIYAQVLIQDYLTANQIAFHAPVMLQGAGANFTNVIAEHDSEPLYEIVKTMLKHSDNLITNALLKKIGQVYYGSQGTWSNGIYAIRGILSKSAGVNFNHLLIADGAGLSRYNLVSPHELIKVLYYAYHQDQVIGYLLNALPIAGVDGTLRWRMPNLGKTQSVHAKTGTMNGVSALAGYVNTANNGTLAFVIMVNGFVDQYAPYRGFQDRICQYLAIAPRV